MYKALHQQSGQEIVILDQRWMKQIAYLRLLDRKDAIVCPGCRQPVRVRAGRIKRWHFAHKHLENCPYERESPTLLKMRAVLYTWLVGKFGEDNVTIEKRLDSPKLCRPVDCWVKSGDQTFPYWLIDRRLPPAEREDLKAGFADINATVIWVFAIDLLRVDEFSPKNRLHLTTTERAFTRQSSLDQAWQTHLERLGGSLHYLDADTEALTTYRNLTVVHKPQLYAGTWLQDSLAEVLVSTSSGEFVHPGEIEQLTKRQGELERWEREAEARLQRAKEFLRRASQREMPSSLTEEAKPGATSFVREGTCRICGRLTSDWVTYFGDTKECICRNCQGR
jgi:hypothetical protein